MATIEHDIIDVGEIHRPYNFSYANAAARTGATGFIAADVGKFARQVDDNSIWMLTATTPTWEGIGGGAAGVVDSVFGRTGTVVAATSDYDANQVDFTPAGSIAATDVQAAIAELDTEKAALASPTFTGTPAAPTAAPATNTTQIATTAFVQQELTAAGVPTTEAIQDIVGAMATDGNSLDFSYDDGAGTFTADLKAAVAGDGLAHSAGVLSVGVDGSTIEINADALRVKDSGITAAKLADAAKTFVVNFVIDGGGSAIATGIKGDIHCDFGANVTILAVTLLADQSGSIVVDLWKDTYANFAPTVADTITAAAKPTISAATKSQDTTLTGWTTTITDGDVIRVNVDSAATVTRVTLSLKVRRA